MSSLYETLGLKKPQSRSKLDLVRQTIAAKKKELILLEKCARAKDSDIAIPMMQVIEERMAIAEMVLLSLDSEDQKFKSDYIGWKHVRDEYTLLLRLLVNAGKSAEKVKTELSSLIEELSKIEQQEKARDQY